jgi:hypothetical protein
MQGRYRLVSHHAEHPKMRLSLNWTERDIRGPAQHSQADISDMTIDYEYMPHVPLWLHILILAIVLSVTTVVYVISSLLQSFLFRKMGIEMWKAWVPVYSSWLFLEAANLPGAWVLLALGGVVPFVGPLFSLAAVAILTIAAYRIAVAFAKEAALYTVLYVFCAPVFHGILGLGAATFDKSKLPARPEASLF